MKVTTLACIQGSWIPMPQPKQVLDIGAGTGLLSLMIAQKSVCRIHAVEIEAGAFKQLVDNVVNSPWDNRINCHHEDIVRFTAGTKKTFDFIISNPPFFINHLKSPDIRINQARHDDSLTIESLIKLCVSLLDAQGKISILLPVFETEKLRYISGRYSLFINDQLVIHDTEDRPPKAIISILSRGQKNTPSQKLIIKEKNGQYSTYFTSLLKDYYLNL
jgi:tRNA1Val (adenine37-N6)-methyltransferase